MLIITSRNSLKMKEDEKSDLSPNQININGFVRHIATDKDSRKIFFLLLISFFFTFVEIFYGLMSNSLSLISDSAHMLFDSSALGIGLYASWMSKMKPDFLYTYGYVYIFINYF